MEQGVPISSRGSAASSLVAYCLEITTPDPLALDLYFERFLNPARATPPDIDTDLCSERRDEVLQHVYDQYGADHVAMVATINRFRPRSALRDVAKAYGLTSKEISDLVEGIPSRGWGPASRRNDRDAPFGDSLAELPPGCRHLPGCARHPGFSAPLIDPSGRHRDQPGADDRSGSHPLGQQRHDHYPVRFEIYRENGTGQDRSIGHPGLDRSGRCCGEDLQVEQAWIPKSFGCIGGHPGR